MCKIINNLKKTLICIFLLSPIHTDAQIVDLIGEYVADYIVGEVKGYLNNAASNFWDSCVENQARSSITEKAKELQDFQTNQSYISHILATSSLTKGQYFVPNELLSPIESGINKQFMEALYSLNNQKMGTLGNGKLLMWTTAYKDSLVNKTNYSKLEDALSKEVLDSIMAFVEPRHLNSVLHDINKDKRLVSLFNNHPQSVRAYMNLSQTTLKGDLSYLYYWSVTADSHRERFSKKLKAKLINPRQIKFVEYKGDVNLYIGNSLIGSIDAVKNQINILSADLLNLQLKENVTYKYGETEFKTDMFGRIVLVTFPLDKSDKKIAKTTIKYKEICKSVGIRKGHDLYSLIMKPYKETPSIAFAVPIDKTKNFKQQLKALKKEAKRQLKGESSAKLLLSIDYNDMSGKPCLITAHLKNMETFFELVNNGQPLIIKSNDAKLQEHKSLSKIRATKINNNSARSLDFSGKPSESD